MDVQHPGRQEHANAAKGSAQERGKLAPAYSPLDSMENLSVHNDCVSRNEKFRADRNSNIIRSLRGALAHCVHPTVNLEVSASFSTNAVTSFSGDGLLGDWPSKNARGVRTGHFPARNGATRCHAYTVNLSYSHQITVLALSDTLTGHYAMRRPQRTRLMHATCTAVPGTRVHGIGILGQEHHVRLSAMCVTCNNLLTSQFEEAWSFTFDRVLFCWLSACLLFIEPPAISI
jgi:hypothetical protein